MSTTHLDRTRPISDGARITSRAGQGAKADGYRYVVETIDGGEKWGYGSRVAAEAAVWVLGREGRAASVRARR